MLKKWFFKIKWFFKNAHKLHSNPEVVYGPLTYNEDGLFTRNNADFLKDKKFISAYSKSEETESWKGFSIRWRVYIVCKMAEQIKHLDGDFVECGVNRGGLSYAMVHYIDFQNTNKLLFLLDTFTGYDSRFLTQEEKDLDLINKYASYNEDSYEYVQSIFSKFKCKVIKGAVPDTLPQCETQKVAYLSIDMNCVEPEIAAFRYFWPKMVKGGIVILDDYGFPDHILQKNAFDKLSQELHFNIIQLPTGQALIFKN
jgi:O-methyltransferase